MGPGFRSLGKGRIPEAGRGARRIPEPGGEWRSRTPDSRACGLSAKSWEQNSGSWGAGTCNRKWNLGGRGDAEADRQLLVTAVECTRDTDEYHLSFSPEPGTGAASG